MVITAGVLSVYLIMLTLTAGLVLLGADAEWMLRKKTSVILCAVLLVAVLWPVTLPMMAMCGMVRLFMRKKIKEEER